MEQVIDFTNISEHIDFYENDYYVFGLYRIKEDGTCGCEYPDCKTAGKHPIRSGWQHPIKWDAEQWLGGHMAGQFKTGYGVLMKGLLVIDVDAKNGGVASFTKLMIDLPELAQCGLVVETGSGGGSKHLYFKYDGSKALRQAHEKYPGIDFKSTGFVVGPGSLHKSGKRYTVSKGAVTEINDAPSGLLELLERTGTYRINDDDGVVDVSEEEIRGLLSYIPNDLEYDSWIAIGMALNDSLEGDGYDLFNEWSSQSDKYDEATTHIKWRSFKPGGGVGFPTLKWYALQNGWHEPVTFELPPGEFEDKDVLDLDGVDLHRPPGFVGKVCDWINDQCPKPRESLAVAAALTSVGNISGQRYQDDLPLGTSSNLFTLCVAGSGSGKNAIVQAINQIHDVAGLLPVTYGKSKSSQEIYRNLIDKPTSLFNIDEMGIKFSSIANASKSGASYFETWFGEMMSLYSNANGIVNLSGDEMREVVHTLQAKMRDVQKQMDENLMDEEQGKVVLKRLEERIERPALINPFVSLIGCSTPETMEPIVTPERVREGFLGRTILAWEPVDLPRDKEGFSKRAMTNSLAMTLKSLASSGDTSVPVWEPSENRKKITTTPGARKLIEELRGYFHDLSERYLEENGMHAVPTRGLELVLKISYILAIPGFQRTEEHVKWALAFTLRDIDQKVRMAIGNSDRDDALPNRILSVLDKEEALSEGRLVDRVRGRNKFKKDDILTALQSMVECSLVEKISNENVSNGRIVSKYLLSH